MGRRLNARVGAITLTGLIAVASANAQAAAGDVACTQAGLAPVVTNHTARIGGQDIAYSATASFIHVTAADAKSQACIFYTAYHQTNASPSQPRPVTFAFNGGPGSASLWLHLGALGPKRVDMGPTGMAPHQPFNLVPNESSLLDLSDVVMIDPVATGFTQVDTGSDAKQFYGVMNDYKSIAEFIRNYLTQFDRWSSPKFVAGESYGGIRAPLLVAHLQRDFGINMSGMILISPWMSTATTNFNDPGNDLAYAAYLPTYATTAWYHKKQSATSLAKSIDEMRAEVEAYAFGPYLDALALGNDLPESQRQAVIQKLVAYTGLSSEFIDQHNLRIADEDFFANLFINEHKRVGRFDTRFVEGVTGNTTDDQGFDPSDAVITPPYTAAMNDYLINDLNWHSQTPYVTGANLSVWPFNADGQEFGVMDQVSEALLDNPALRIYIASGLYDLAVPYGTTKYNIRHLAPYQGLPNRISFGYFESGHMVYTNPASLTKLKADLKTFFGAATARP